MVAAGKRDNVVELFDLPAGKLALAFDAALPRHANRHGDFEAAPFDEHSAPANLELRYFVDERGKILPDNSTQRLAPFPEQNRNRAAQSRLIKAVTPLIDERRINSAPSRIGAESRSRRGWKKPARGLPCGSGISYASPTVSNASPGMVISARGGLPAFPPAPGYFRSSRADC